jgi:hypothetical protein
VTVNHGIGGSNVNLNATSSTTIGGTLSITAAQGNDTVTLGAAGASVSLHNVNINQGAGDNTVVFNADSNTVTGNLAITNGDGLDSFDMTAVSFTVTGNVTITNGDGGSTTALDAATSNSIGGALAITNGAGNDAVNFGGNTLDLHNVTIINSNHDSTVNFTGANQTITGNLSVINASGNDVLSVGGNTFAVTGAMTVNHGGGGNTTTIAANISNDVGALSLVSADGPDSFIGVRLAVALGTVVNTGDGADLVNFDNSTFNGAVTINTGAGQDTILIERNPSTNVSTTFRAPVTINTGSGDDSLGIGLDADDRAIFQLGPITFNGGAGFDAISFLAGGFNSFPPGQPIVLSFESVS